ncbi:MAG: phage holin family protein [Nitrospira sp.]|nr:phage holin family protein [Nitrospira sp.]
MRGFVLRVVVTGVAVLVASRVITGVTIDSFASGLVGVLGLAMLNAVVRPLLYVLSIPFIVVTLGLFMVVINAFLLWVVAFFVQGFHVAGWWSAIGGALLVSLISGAVNLMLSGQGHVEVVRPRRIKHIN